MLDGRELKYDRLRKAQRNGIEHNSVALSLPVYRTLVYRTADVIIEYLYKYIEDNKNKMGRPGINKMAIPYIESLGVEKAASIAISTVVNNFHRPISYQALSLKIGSSLSYEWSILQEDPKLVSRINSDVYKGSNTKRKSIYLRLGLQKKLGRSLQSIPQIGRAALGNMFLSLLVDAELLDDSCKSRKGLTMLVASQQVLDFLDKGLEEFADNNPIRLPNLSPEEADPLTIIKPQRGRDFSLSSTKPDSMFIKACNSLNNVAYRISQNQYDFLNALSSYKYPVLGLPSSKMPELTLYTDNMSEEEKKNVRALRAKTYADRLIWRAKRTKYLSVLHGLKHYLNKDVYFNVTADFRGRIYPETELLSYQGPDWLRSMWEFTDGKAIRNEDEAKWLYIHAANCYGLSRKPFPVRMAFITQNHALIKGIAEAPEDYIQEIEKAEHPFRFVAAARELNNFWTQGYGYISHLPIQMDASSQGIQLWSSIADDTELMKASNVIDSGEFRDIYQELADQIYQTALQSSDVGAETIRIEGVSRKTAKAALMLIPYGGSYYSILNSVDNNNNTWPMSARLWLSKQLWTDGRDKLHSLVAMQQQLSNAVFVFMSSGPSSLRWETPSGFSVVQKYNKTEIKRVKNVLGKSIYQFHFETDEPDIAKNASAFPPNLLHSLDSSLLCRAITESAKEGIFNIMPVHDCVGVLSADAPEVHTILKHAFRWAVTPKLGWVEFAPESCYDGTMKAEEFLTYSDYLFS